ncbi:MAG TPA: gephyrin-like molybdotransferase Glp [Thermohalobaculum sp.]|nr:gephyrin-like molybdotransferase Glp [Thermohalobaculum sp.]
MSGPLSVEEALARVLALVTPMGVEEVPLAEAAGRVLAEDVVAARAQPPFASSAMDGYAVRAAEAVAGARMRLAGEAAAGRGAGIPLPPGAAIRIFTGAPVPEGADAILIQENARREGDTVVVADAPEAGVFVRPAGGDFAAGFRIAAPCRLTPQRIALAAAMNAPRLRVRRRPVVALMPTGDELVEPGQAPGPDQIVSSNGYGLAASVQAAGATPLLCGIARDTRESLLAALDAARAADFIVTLGGASVGDHDLVAEVLEQAGLALDFYKVAMRPGKPLMAGRLDGRVMLGLPGNPVSAMVCGEVFLRPALDAALGLPAGPRPTVPARLAAPVERTGARTHYMRARLSVAGDGLVCEPFARQDSSLLATLAAANALAIRPPNAPEAAAGARIDCIPLGPIAMNSGIFSTGH